MDKISSFYDSSVVKRNLNLVKIKNGSSNVIKNHTTGVKLDLPNQPRNMDTVKLYIYDHVDNISDTRSYQSSKKFCKVFDQQTQQTITNLSLNNLLHHAVKKEDEL